LCPFFGAVDTPGARGMTAGRFNSDNIFLN